MAYPEFTTAELETEEWRPVPGYEGRYSASTLGRIRCDGGKRRGCIVRPGVNKNGRWNVHFFKGGRHTTFRWHQVITLTFIGPCPEGKQINHIDGVKTNNRPENLEYVTYAENRRHAVEHGLHSRGDAHYSRTQPHRLARGKRHGSQTHPEALKRGEHHHSAKLTVEKVREIRRLYKETKTSQAKLGRQFGVNQATVYNIIKRIIWAHVD